MAEVATFNGIEFSELVRHQRAGWIAAAFVVVGNRERAEEIVQEALSRAAQRWDEVGALDLPGAWVRKVVVISTTLKSPVPWCISPTPVAASLRNPLSPLQWLNRRALRPCQPASAAGFFSSFFK